MHVLLKRYPLFALVPVLFVVVVTYWGVLENGFVWDDKMFLDDSVLYQDPDLIWRALVSPFFVEIYYRPFGVLTYMVEYIAFDGEPRGFHATNLILHGLNVLLVGWLAIRTLPGSESENKYLPAVLAATVYGLHPALVEGVAWVSARFDLLLTTCLLAVLVFDLHLFRDRARFWAIGIAYLLAACTKETAAFFPLAYLFARMAIANDWRLLLLRRNGVAVAAMVIAGVVYLILRWHAIGAIADSRLAADGGSMANHAALIAATIVEYLKLVLLPFLSLAPVHYLAKPVPFDAAAAVNIAISCVGMLALVGLVRWKPRIGWWGVAGTAMLLPVANVMPVQLGLGAFVAERYLIFPLAMYSIGLAHAASDVLTRKPSRPSVRGVGIAVLAVWLLAAAANIRVTVPLWQSNETLWRWAVQKAPQSAVAAANLAWGLSERPTGLAEAEHWARRAVELDPKSPEAWSGLGSVLVSTGRSAEALPCFEEAIRLEGRQASLLKGLGASLLFVGRVEEAVSVLSESVVKQPYELQTHRLLAEAYLDSGRKEAAMKHLRLLSEMTRGQERIIFRQFVERRQLSDELARAGIVIGAPEEHRSPTQ